MQDICLLAETINFSSRTVVRGVCNVSFCSNMAKGNYCVIIASTSQPYGIHGPSAESLCRSLDHLIYYTYPHKVSKCK